ncbi:MAG: ABC transporter substrate-binding protein [Candidatus Rokuibacteriota bacterium]|nr:MAG: ABC transporter substrate-binding protein [Candidatus Rokubacteria bacterium]
MRLIGLAIILPLSLAVAPLAAHAQPPEKTARIGVMRWPPDLNIDPFRQSLSALGYREGQNLLIEELTSKSYEDLPRVAAQLVRRKVNVILAVGTPAARVARDAITTIPVVFLTFADPVRTGLVASLARPERNVTGVTMIAAELAGKRLEPLKEALPSTTCVVALWNPANRDTEEELNQTRSAARSLGIQLDVHAARTPEELEGAFTAMARERADAFLMLSDPMFASEGRRIAGLAERNGLPGMSHRREYVDVGGLMSYGPNLIDVIRRAANYADKIIKGAKPADLPVEQPAKFELVINLKTARRLGLRIPPSVLLRADQVIE